jgi:hypothetical protein
LDDERERLGRERQVLVEKRAGVIGPMVQRRIEDLEKALKAEPLDRTNINVLMRQVFSGVKLDHENPFGLPLQAWWGGRRDVRVACRGTGLSLSPPGMFAGGC